MKRVALIFMLASVTAVDTAIGILFLWVAMLGYGGNLADAGLRQNRLSGFIGVVLACVAFTNAVALLRIANAAWYATPPDSRDIICLLSYVGNAACAVVGALLWWHAPSAFMFSELASELVPLWAFAAANVSAVAIGRAALAIAK